MDDWIATLEAAQVPVGPVNTIDKGFEAGEELGLDPVDEIEGIRTPSSPISLSRTPAETRLPPPGENAHAEEIRAWLREGR